MGTTTLLSAEEFLKLPDEPGKQELLDGELIPVPPAELTDLRVIHNLHHLLTVTLPAARIWIEGGYQLGPRTWLQPEVSVDWPEQRVENYWLQGSPLLAVEVVSPANRPEDIDKKTAAYLQHGAAEVWVIHPTTPSMVVFRKHNWERVTESHHCDILNLTVNLPELLRTPE
jgi:Uma2 family endonuclease